MGHLDGPMGVAKKDGERTRTAGGFGSLLPITGLLDGGRPQCALGSGITNVDGRSTIKLLG